MRLFMYLFFAVRIKSQQLIVVVKHINFTAFHDPSTFTAYLIVR